MNNKIDFVVLWVDGADEKWLEEKKQYRPELDISDSVIRFRDWKTLKYWFRGVEKYASWVNKIYFVTYGHLPDFLNVDNKKLVIVNHKDFMNKEYLPTYNSNALDLNLHKIKGLNNKFVYFNDDTFIIDYVKPSDFFKNDLPRDLYAESSILPADTIFPYSLFNNAFVINKHFNKKSVYKKHLLKYLNFKYGIHNFRTILSLSYKKFVGFYTEHLPIPFLKEYYEKVWNLEEELCEQTSKNKFRTKEDITLYLIKEFQMLEANFYPRSRKFGKYFMVSNNNAQLISAIKNQKYKVLCANDNNVDIDFEKAQQEIIDAFESILPNKSSYEK